MIFKLMDLILKPVYYVFLPVEIMHAQLYRQYIPEFHHPEQSLSIVNEYFCALSNKKS